MAQRRHLYDRRFKLAAAVLVLEGGIPVVQISDGLDVPASTLRRWVAEYAGDGARVGLVGFAEMGGFLILVLAVKRKRRH